MQIPLFSGSFKVDMETLKRKYEMPLGDSPLDIQRAANRDAERLCALAHPHQPAIQKLPFDLVYTGEGPYFHSLGVDEFSPRIEIRREGTKDVLHQVRPDPGYQPYRSAKWEKILSKITLGLFEDLEDKNRPARDPETEDAFIARAVTEAEAMKVELDKEEMFCVG
jgi:hypothetical protein